MVKASSHHGLDRKYKPWRRGASEKAKGKKGSLKQQLRGLQRLLAKSQNDEHKESIQKQIIDLERQIGGKEKVEKEKQNARKSHGVRFLERQRLTRMWQAASKLSDDLDRKQAQIRIGLDMVYVAHYPHEVRYQPLFRKKERILLDGRNLARRAAARGKILSTVRTIERASWIPAQVYDDCPIEWSNEKEREVFGVVTPSSDQVSTMIQDDRFSSLAAARHKDMLEAAEAVNAELEAEEAQTEDDEKKISGRKVGNDDDSYVDSSSEGMVTDDGDDDVDDGASGVDPDDADPLKEKMEEKGNILATIAGKSAASENILHDQSPKAEEASDETNSSSDSSAYSDDSDSDSDTTQQEGGRVKPPPKVDSKNNQLTKEADDSHDRDNQEHDEGDDFLMPLNDEAQKNDIFSNAKEQVPSVDEARGNKSQGWATQRQRPGQFKKRRVRR